MTAGKFCQFGKIYARKNDPAQFLICYADREFFRQFKSQIVHESEFSYLLFRSSTEAQLPFTAQVETWKKRYIGKECPG